MYKGTATRENSSSRIIAINSFLKLATPLLNIYPRRSENYTGREAFANERRGAPPAPDRLKCSPSMVKVVTFPRSAR